MIAFLLTVVIAVLFMVIVAILLIVMIAILLKTIIAILLTVIIGAHLRRVPAGTRPHGRARHPQAPGAPQQKREKQMDSLRGSSVKIGTIQRRLAWPLRKDATHKSRSVNKGDKQTITKLH